MKKSIIILCIAVSTIGLTAFGVINWSDSGANNSCCAETSCSTTAEQTQENSDFVYMVQPRFLRTVTTEVLASAQTILDIVPEPRDMATIETYYNIEVSTFLDDNRGLEIMKRGDSEVLTEEQMRLLRSMDNSTSLFIVGNVMRTNGVDGELYSDTLIYYMSVVPHRPSEYVDGHQELISYLKRNSKKAIGSASQSDMAPGKINFLVTKDGLVDDVQLEYSCGQSSIDERMLEIVKEIPGRWKVATNAKGEKVDEKLTFFFGNQGC